MNICSVPLTRGEFITQVLKGQSNGLVDSTMGLAGMPDLMGATLRLTLVEFEIRHMRKEAHPGLWSGYS